MESAHRYDDPGIRVKVSSNTPPIPRRADIRDRKRYIHAIIQRKRTRNVNGFKRLSQRSSALAAKASHTQRLMADESVEDVHECTESRIYRKNAHLVDFAHRAHGRQEDELDRAGESLRDPTLLCVLLGSEVSQPQPTGKFLIGLDSCAEEHSLNDRDMFEDLEVITAREVIGVGSATITEVGSVKLILTAPDGSTTTLRLENVLFAPSLPLSLISIGLLEEAGIECDLFRGQMKQNGKLISTISKQNKAYLVQVTLSAQTAARSHIASSITPQVSLRPHEYYSQPLPTHRTLQVETVHKDLSRRFTGRSDRIIQHASMNEAMVSGRPILPAPAEDSVAKARADIFNALKDRLQKAGLSAGQTLDVRLIHFVMPSSQVQADIWRLLLESPITTSDGLVDQLFSLRLSTASSPRPDPDHIVFYLRTYAYTAQELLYVLRAMQQQSYDLSDQAQSWLEDLNLDIQEDDQSAFYYIRYIGQTKGQRGYDRMIQDRSAAPAFGRTFLQLTERHFPDVVRDCKIQEFSSAIIETPNIDSRVADLREQVIIAIFYQGSLNVAAGGLRLDIKPTSEDEKAFVLLRTKVITRLSELIQCPQQVTTDIKAYVDTCRAYARDNPDLTGTSDPRFRITPEIAAIQLEKAIPRTFKNQSSHCTPFCLLGSGYPKTFASDTRPWVLQKTTSADVLRFAINYCGSWELPLGILDDELTRKLHNAGNIPHIDGFPWYDTWGSGSDLSAVCDFAREYLQAARPLVVICFSSKMFSLATNNFQTGAGTLPDSNFSSIAGQPKLCYYGEKDYGETDEWTVVIPCPHPGFVSQNPKASQELLRFFLLVFGVGWLAISLSMDAVDRDPTASRRSITQAVRNLVERDTDRSTSFGALLADARTKALEARNASQYGARGRTGQPRQAMRDKNKALRQDLVTARKIANQQPVKAVASIVSRMQTKTVDGRILIHSRTSMWQDAQTEATKVIAFGTAQKRPNTPGRQNANRMHADQRPVLFSDLTGQTRPDWEKWALQVKEHQPFLLEATTIEEQIDQIPNLIRVFRKDESLDAGAADLKVNIQETRDAAASVKKWFADNKLHSVADLTSAFYLLRSRLDKKVHKVLKKEAKAKKNVISESIAFDLDGNLAAGVSVQMEKYTRQGGQAGKEGERYKLSWTTNSTRYEMRGFSLHADVIPKKDETRTMHFVKTGIDIRNEAGQTLGIKRRQGTATISLHPMLLMLEGEPVKEAFIDLWEHSTGTTVSIAMDELAKRAPEAEPSSAAMVVPSAFFKDSNNRAIPAVASWRPQQTEAFLETRPFKPGDEAYLVFQFLEQYYPRGSEHEIRFVGIQGGSVSVWSSKKKKASQVKKRQREEGLEEQVAQPGRSRQKLNSKSGTGA